MTFIVKTLTHKLADAAWFNATNPVAATTLKSWTATQTGIVSSRRKLLGQNTVQHTMVFDTQASYETYAAAAALLPEATARAAHAATTGQTVTMRKFQEIK